MYKLTLTEALFLCKKTLYKIHKQICCSCLLAYKYPGQCVSFVNKKTHRLKTNSNDNVSIKAKNKTNKVSYTRKN